MFEFLKNIWKTEEDVTDFSLQAFEVDMHSHILPGLDDGAETLEKSLMLVEEMMQLGYRKLIMTPHIMGDFYRNTPETIKEKLDELKAAVLKNGWPIELDFAAEYYLDEVLAERLHNQEQLLTFGDNYLLFETSYINEALNLKEVVFMMKASGYKPVLAHPERYTYLYGRFEELVELRDSGVLMQLNLNSLTGYYSSAAKAVAEKLIDNKMVDFVGTDVHSFKHIQALHNLPASTYLKKLMQLPVRNASL
ncbi:MAG: capsular biosynthesis protein [Hymenobacteraceae bacterium]|nr:capsular biosynthesis protein [Hymenobacteraceae bacterium]MDX5397201.1 capsular biosynthesis protein [Hymenobacteraceae bacterium]MDX5442666.1 capsular biosynthesis protein [Hymenobacteraceae bacterium]MDX5513277.1 capsular biosynthesis protein [Hymenobacteraceae bacterium]